LLGGVLARLPMAGAATEARPFAVVDLHVDLSYQVNYKNRPLAEGSGQYRARDLLRAGIVGVVLPLYIPRRVSPTGPRLSDLESSFLQMSTTLAATAPYAAPGCGPAAGRVRTWFAFEGSAPLAREPGAARQWASRNVRLFGLVHTYDNALATSSGPAAEASQGLSSAGREFVESVHAAGGIVDVSHASDLATAEVIALAERAHAPVVATHSNARALTPHRRNLTDDQLQAIARTGGVVGVNFHGPYVAARAPARLSDVVRHVRHLLRVAGPDHVAIGSDFEGDIRPPSALADVSRFQNLARALQAASIPDETITKVLSTNALRLLCRADARGGTP
jgi:membrane dipeptidase